MGINWQVVLPVFALTLAVAGLGMLVCLGLAVGVGGGGEGAFGVSAALALALGALTFLVGRRLPATGFRARDGFFAVTAVWLLAAAVGALPFLLEGTFTRPSDAFFESMGGFTTNGASLIVDIEAQPESILLWRSISQWLGGVGMVVLVVAVAPATGLASTRFFYAEVTGPTNERITPRIADTAKIILGIYVGITAAACLAYLLAGMGPFDAINHGLTTLATGGFSTRSTSLAAFDSLSIELVAMVFMILAGVNFVFYWRLLRGDRSLFPQLAEVRAYLLIVSGAVIALTASLLVANDVEGGFGPALRAGAFTAVSIGTGTALTTADFDLWNDFARVGLVTLFFVGGCAGSTTGGLKVVRVMLLAKSAVQEVKRQLSPKAVQVLRIRGRVFPEEVRLSVLGFFYIYVLVYVLATLALTACGLDLITAASAAAANLNVVGAGLGEAGAVESYQSVPVAGLWVLDACMLIGRLEVFTVLVLLLPAFWQRGRS